MLMSAPKVILKQLLLMSVCFMCVVFFTQEFSGCISLSFHTCIMHRMLPTFKIVELSSQLYALLLF